MEGNSSYSGLQGGESKQGKVMVILGLIKRLVPASIRSPSVLTNDFIVSSYGCYILQKKKATKISSSAATGLIKVLES